MSLSHTNPVASAKTAARISASSSFLCFPNSVFKSSYDGSPVLKYNSSKHIHMYKHMHLIPEIYFFSMC